MSEFKERKAVSEWIKFELETKELDPPVIELRLSPIESITNVDSFDGSGKFKRFSEVVLMKAMGCVAEWDIKQKGKLLPIEDLKIKERVLRRLLGEYKDMET
ncbi:unnamed protein product [marine sediment metagenome]|uniref:Uncharacterized protein n=1 Tax=marine sediment metagenome TaxID=412755 RepID=X1E1E0_9ZZZZ